MLSLNWVEIFPIVRTPASSVFRPPGRVCLDFSWDFGTTKVVHLQYYTPWMGWHRVGWDFRTPNTVLMSELHPLNGLDLNSVEILRQHYQVRFQPKTSSASLSQWHTGDCRYAYWTQRSHTFNRWGSQTSFYFCTIGEETKIFWSYHLFSKERKKKGREKNCVPLV